MARRRSSKRGRKCGSAKQVKKMPQIFGRVCSSNKRGRRKR